MTRELKILHPRPGDGTVRSGDPSQTLHEHWEATRRDFRAALLTAMEIAGRMEAIVTELQAQPVAPPARPSRRYLPIREVAGELGIGRTKVGYLLDRGELREVRIDGKRLVLAESVQEYAEKLEAARGDR